MPKPAVKTTNLHRFEADIRACRICVETPAGKPLPHDPRPVLQVSATAKLAIFGQAPGLRVHKSGKPFTDPSGVRLREWLGIGEDKFYDARQLAIIPMGFCFPGYNDKGADLPPRKECAKHWREKLMARMPQLELALLVGGHAQKWHLGKLNAATLRETVLNWREIFSQTSRPAYLPVPHPSWRNNAWLKANPWFENELLPELRRRVTLLTSAAARAPDG